MAETTTTTTTTTKPEEMDETSERLIKTENYISKILSFIPTNLYVPPPEEEERRHYWTKPTESEKQKMKFESKKAKRLRLDPTSGAADVVEMQQKQKQLTVPSGKNSKSDKEEEVVDGDNEEEETTDNNNNNNNNNDNNSNNNNSNDSPTDDNSKTGKINKLKERLVARIANLRDQRKGAGKRLKRALKKSEKKALNNGVNNNKKNKRQKSKKNSKNGKDDTSSDETISSSDASNNIKINNKNQSKKRKKSSIPEMMSDIKFSSIEGVGKANSHIGAGEPKRKKNLQKLLKEAQKKQQRMAELKEQGGGKIPQYAWDASMARAMGDKVLDDPKLIKKSIKRREKEKAKSRAKWEKRNQSVFDANEKIMDRKRENMKKLDMVRQAKKQGKSLKLLDLKPSNQAQQKRPGFEGRRDSPLNSAKKIKSRGGSSK